MALTDSQESPTVIRQIDLVFLLKRDIDSINKRQNIQDCLLRRVEKFLRYLQHDQQQQSKSQDKQEDQNENSKLFTSPKVGLKYDQFRRDYRQLKRKRRKLLKNLPKIDLYDKLYDLYESFTMSEVEVDLDEEIKKMMMEDEKKKSDADDEKTKESGKSYDFGNGVELKVPNGRFGLNSLPINFKMDDDSNSNSNNKIKEEMDDYEVEEGMDMEMGCDNDYLYQELMQEEDDQENGFYDNRDLDYKPGYQPRSGMKRTKRAYTKSTSGQDDEDDNSNSCIEPSRGPRIGSGSKAVFKRNQRMLYKCNYEGCSFVTKWSTSLKCHRKSHSGNQRRYQCDVLGCNYSTHWPNGLRCHKLSHNKVPRFKCTLNNCTYTTNWLDCWKSHKKSHDPERLLKCDFEGCNYVTGWPNGLKKHKLTHFPDFHVQAPERSGGSLHCDFKGCSYSTNWSASLNEHKLYHDVVHRFRCDFDGCFFATDKFDNLNNHRMSHIVEQRYHCSIPDCTFECNSSSQLTAHKKHHHHSQKSKQLMSKSKSSLLAARSSLISLPSTSNQQQSISIVSNSVSSNVQAKVNVESPSIQKELEPEIEMIEYNEEEEDSQQEYQSEGASLVDTSSCKPNIPPCVYRLDSTPLFRCRHPDCDFVAVSMRQLNGHQATHPNFDPTRLKCNITGCNYSSNRQSNLNRHMLSHMNNARKTNGKLPLMMAQD